MILFKWIINFFKGLFKLFLSPFTKEFWCGKFPEDRPPECFDCNRDNCIDCEHLDAYVEFHKDK